MLLGLAGNIYLMAAVLTIIALRTTAHIALLESDKTAARPLGSELHEITLFLEWIRGMKIRSL
ncbi:MAG: hypothetical protein D3906_11065 [Candidatus Electrothrix sp. AUS1_2]|nr:hypothetical protein [Candidatus Electrothrix sp. AUS1_2]